MDRGSYRIRTTHAHLASQNALPSQADAVSSKDEVQALAARKEGNKFFLSKSYIKALMCYNKSLCYALDGSESMAIGYANRSAIFLDTGFFKFCLENIELALENPYPEKLVPKLLKRKEDCLKRMKTQKDSFDIYGKPKDIKLSYPANPKIPFVINALYCKKDERYGRGIFTKQNLKVGDFILIDEHQNTVLREPHIYSQCTHCGFNNFYNLKPCKKSTHAMFCSDKCTNEAWDRYHKYLYSVMPGIFKHVNRVSARSSLRAILSAIFMSGGLNELKELVESIDVEKENAFDLDFTAAGEREKFRVYYSLESNSNDRSPDTKLATSTWLAYAWHMVKEFTEFKELLTDPDLEDTFLDIIFRLAEIADTNGDEISNPFSVNDEGSSKVESYGSGVRFIYSYFNHSCCHNVKRLPGTNAVYILRPVKAGEQLFDCYGPCFLTHPLNVRQPYLSGKYYFKCNCAACRDNYGLLEMLPIKKNLGTQILQIIRASRGQQNKGQVTKDKDAIVQILNKNDHLYPAMEISSLQYTLFHLMDYLYSQKSLNDILSPKSSH